MAKISKQIILFESEKAQSLTAKEQRNTTPSRSDCMFTAGKQGGQDRFCLID